MHDLGQIGPGGLQQQVIVVVHLKVRMHPRIVPLAGRGQISQKLFPVAAAFEDRLALVAARGHLVKGTGIANSQGPRHRSSLFAMPQMSIMKT